ncbi:hypothetical protein PROFUN_00542 [Planoprotostelium fungivorum]|uniref:Metallo-beta-lactamase domain-containing protein n=1 Tax=Planoprotostelium fungivorum TaxID=1890364 RepID=A0A2P6N177_9EUKA|nr:hypothetical protein PROFUN_00542 [Planoprotostelium fungivorum]
MTQLTFTPLRKQYDTPPSHHVLGTQMWSNITSILSPNVARTAPAQPTKPRTVGFTNPWPSHQKLSMGQIKAGLEWRNRSNSDEGTAPPDCSYSDESDNEKSSDLNSSQESCSDTDEDENKETSRETGKREKKKTIHAIRGLKEKAQKKLLNNNEGEKLVDSPNKSRQSKESEKKQRGSPFFARSKSKEDSKLEKRKSSEGRRSSVEDPRNAADELLEVHAPHFGDIEENTARATWLGHAGVLLQFPSLSEGGSPVRIVVDPIFSNRCFPSQSAGPLRSFPPPCPITSLPPIHLFVLSHNHYDHLDSDTVTALWKNHRQTLHFVVPLGNGDWFKQSPLNVPADRIIELDWWDDVIVTSGNVRKGAETQGRHLRVTCTPAQHNSGRFKMDSGASLWASWYFTYVFTPSFTFRTYFAGDTGFQIHGPEGPRETSAYPRCPAFEEISRRLGSPDLSLLPISVGATAGYLKKSIGFFPRVNPSIMSANHIGAWDAVRLHHIMRDASEAQRETWRPRPVSMAIHWGTFVGGMEDVQQSIRDLKKSCRELELEFGRLPSGGRAEKEGEKRGKFYLVNHGESLTFDMREYEKAEEECERVDQVGKIEEKKEEKEKEKEEERPREKEETIEKLMREEKQRAPLLKEAE